MSLSDHYTWRALQIHVHQPAWRRDREYSKMLGEFHFDQDEEEADGVK